LTQLADYATIVRMTSARILAMVLALSLCPALAQKPTEGMLTVMVLDQTGAPIPGARIAAIATVTGLRFEATTDGTGQAALHLIQGNYELKVEFPGFQRWSEKRVEVNTEWVKRNVTLMLDQCEPCMVVEVPNIPLESTPMTAEIPLIPMPQFVPRAKPLRPGAHWF
jgi:hypothetical protein